MSDRIRWIAVMGFAADEGDAAGDAVAFATPDHGSPGHGGPQIINP